MIVSACEALSRAICPFRSVSESCVRLDGDDSRRQRPEPSPQPREHVLAVLRVLVEHGDACLRPCSLDVPPVKRTLAREAREEAHRPLVLPTLERQRREAAADEELRDSELVQVRVDRQRVLGPDAV